MMKKPEEFSVKQLLELFDNDSINAEQLNHLVRELRSAAHEQEPVCVSYFDGSMIHTTWKITPPTTGSLALYAGPAQETVSDCNRALVRTLDTLLNGDGAAKQASLCDIVAQVAGIVNKTGVPLLQQSSAVAVPDGWKLVPKTPTHEMLLASAKAAPTEGPDLTPRSSWTQWAPNARWAAMLNAAPVPPIIAEQAVAVPDAVYCSNETTLKPEVKKHLESLIALRKEMNGEESRAQFHAWADEHGFCMDEVWSSVDEPFENEDTQLAWLIWQASRAVISAQSPRITEQELREIAGSVLGPLQLATMTNIDQWFEREGHTLLNKLNGN